MAQPNDQEVNLRRYRDLDPTRRFMRWSAGTAPMSWFYARVLHHLDRRVFRLTGGRHTLTSWLSGLLVVMVTTTGAKTGRQRTVPVLALTDGHDLVVIASNWGRPQHPAWYHNLCAHPTATVTVRGVTWRVLAREATGEERERLWRRGLEAYPGWAAYQRRAPHRHIRVLVLVPVSNKTA
jgi:deazaflavin-dependent oxidoreductase (nitroreductase family)